jgi:hypothetical protein
VTDRSETSREVTSRASPDASDAAVVESGALGDVCGSDPPDEIVDGVGVVLRGAQDFSSVASDGLLCSVSPSSCATTVLADEGDGGGGCGGRCRTYSDGGVDNDVAVKMESGGVRSRRCDGPAAAAGA